MHVHVLHGLEIEHDHRIKKRASNLKQKFERVSEIVTFWEVEKLTNCWWGFSEVERQKYRRRRREDKV